MTATPATSPSIENPGSHRASLLALPRILILLSVALFVVKGYHDEKTVLHFRDFKQPYASARCLLEGCDPYSEDATLHSFLNAGGDNSDKEVFQAYSALYPPPSLVVLLPVAALRYPVAVAVWLGVISVLVGVAAWRVGELCGPGGGTLATSLVLAVFVFTSTILLMEGQISGPVIALLTIGLSYLLQKRVFWVGVVCLTVALLLKPHDALLLIFVYLPFAGAYWRKAALAILLLASVFTLGSLLWFAHGANTSGWRAELQANLKGNSSPGNVNDPVLANREAAQIADLQVLVGTVDGDPRVYNFAAIAVSGLLLILCVIPMVRLRDARAKHLLALAAIACITPLPIYHRQYDTRLLLLVFPATAWLLGTRRRWGVAAWGLIAVATVATSHKFINAVVNRETAAAIMTPGKALLLYRPLPEMEVLLACFFVASLWMALRDEQRVLRLEG